VLVTTGVGSSVPSDGLFIVLDPDMVRIYLRPVEIVRENISESKFFTYDPSIVNQHRRLKRVRSIEPAKAPKK
jgi:hypothetical protein